MTRMEYLTVQLQEDSEGRCGAIQRDLNTLATDRWELVSTTPMNFPKEKTRSKQTSSEREPDTVCVMGIFKREYLGPPR